MAFEALELHLELTRRSFCLNCLSVRIYQFLYSFGFRLVYVFLGRRCYVGYFLDAQGSFLLNFWESAIMILVKNCFGVLFWSMFFVVDGLVKLGVACACPMLTDHSLN